MNSSYLAKHLVKKGLTALCCIFLFSCDNSRVYEQYVELDKAGWTDKTLCVYRFDIEEPAISYNLFYNVRYNAEYPWYNMYVTYFLYDSTGKELTHKLQGMNIFNPKTGEPFGKGVGSIFDYQILATKKFRFPYKGKYVLKIRQYMRQDVLPGIQALGVRIEKSETD